MAEVNLSEILQRWHVSQFPSLPEPGAGLTRVAYPTTAVFRRRLAQLTTPVEGRLYQAGDAGDRTALTTIQWACLPHQRNELCVDGKPFIVKRLHFWVLEIAWRAEEAQPVYTSYCPRDDFGSGMLFRNHRMHQIVPEFAGVAWGGCHNPGSGLGDSPGGVYFSVNDEDYSDNQGVFHVILTGWE